MDKDQCFFLGTINKVVGFKGEVAVYIDSDEPEKYTSIDAVFLEIKGNLIPFFIENITQRNKNNQLTIKFQDISNQEEAQGLTGCNIYLPLDVLPPLSGNTFYFHEVVDYEITDQEKGVIGKVSQVLDYPGNPLFEIKNENKTILIPVQDQFILKVNREKKTILIKAPEGLIDLYLNE